MSWILLAVVAIGYLIVLFILAWQVAAGQNRWVDFKGLYDVTDGTAVEARCRVEQLEWRVDELMRTLEREISNFVIPSDIAPDMTVTTAPAQDPAGADPLAPPQSSRITTKEEMDKYMANYKTQGGA